MCSQVPSPPSWGDSSRLRSSTSIRTDFMVSLHCLGMVSGITCNPLPLTQRVVQVIIAAALTAAATHSESFSRSSIDIQFNSLIQLPYKPSTESLTLTSEFSHAPGRIPERLGQLGAQRLGNAWTASTRGERVSSSSHTSRRQASLDTHLNEMSISILNMRCCVGAP